MSFYDLTKDFVLSAKDLFKYRGKRNRTIPSRGGQKDFEPDDSRLQKKAFEKFMEERSSVLAEPRVEKLRNLVEGTWDGEKRLINVKKTGKFWAHMGFTDKRRNWLYPEEALFLMECNTLEVYHCGVSLSIQEAYSMFLGSDVNIEEYQVFSHLRRLGFVVLRHEDQPVITAYEKQINLDKYINKKTRKERVAKVAKKGKNLEQNVQSNENTSNQNSVEVSKLATEDPSNVNAALTAPDSKDEVNPGSQSSKKPRKRVAKGGKKGKNLEQDIQSNENTSNQNSAEVSKLATEDPSNVNAALTAPDSKDEVNPGSQSSKKPRKRVAKGGKKGNNLEQDVQSSKNTSDQNSAEVSKLATEDPSAVLTVPDSKDVVNPGSQSRKKPRKERVTKGGKKGKNLEQDVQSNKNTSDQNSAEVSKLATEDPSNLNAALTVPDSKDEVNPGSQSSQTLQAPENISPETCINPSQMEAGETSDSNRLVADIKSTEPSNNSSQELSSEQHSGSLHRKRPYSPGTDSSHEDAKRSCIDATSAFGSSEVNIGNAADADTSLNQDNVVRLFRGVYDNSWESCFLNKTEALTSESSVGNISISKSDSGGQDESSCDNACVKILPLPNIANRDMLVLEPPGPHLLPENVDVGEKGELLKYDVARYHTMNPPREASKQVQREEKEDQRLQGLQFSFPEWIYRKSKPTVSSWKEYKEKLAEQVKDMSQTTPVDHLWTGKVTPLVHPGENWSYQSILDKLSIIQSADNATLLTDSDCVVDVKVTFDVHLPDSRFKKSMPGVPNHRVSVCKCSSDLPGLAELHQVWSRFKDEVPLLWAVVDSGEIAFYVFSTDNSKPFV